MSKIIKNARRLLGKGKSGSALEELLGFLNDLFEKQHPLTQTEDASEIRKELLQNQGSYSRLERERREGILTSQDIDRREAQIYHALDYNINKLENLLKEHPLEKEPEVEEPKEPLISPSMASSSWRKLPIRTLIIAGITVALVVLAIIFFPFSGNPAEDEGSVFTAADSAFLKISLLPFQPEEGQKSRRDDYWIQLHERLKAKQQTEALPLKMKLCDTIASPDNYLEAEKVGKTLNADLLVWGNYAHAVGGQSSGRVRVRYALVNDWYTGPIRKLGDTGYQPVATPAHLREGYLQKGLDFTIYWLAGMAAYKVFDYKNALVHFNKALKFYNKNDEYYPQETYALLGIIYNKLGEFEKGLEFHQKALELYLQEGRLDASDLADYFNNIAVSYHHLGEYGKAYEFFEKTLQLAREDNNVINLAIIYNNIGVCISDQYKDHEKALEYMAKADSIYENNRSIPEDIWTEGVANLKNNTATIYRAKEDCVPALRQQSVSVSMYENILDENDPDLAIIYNNLAAIYDCLYNYSEAKVYYERAIAIQERALPAAHPSLLSTYYNMAAACYEAEDREEALTYLSRLVNTLESGKARASEIFIPAYQLMAQIYEQMGEGGQARVYYDKVLSLQQRLGDTENTATSLNNRAHSLAETGNYREAVETYKDALAILEKIMEPDDPDYVRVARNLALTYNQQALSYEGPGRFEDAIRTYDQALELLIPIVGVRDEDARSIQRNKAQTYNSQAVHYGEQKEYEKAIALYQKALDVQQFLTNPQDETARNIAKNLGVTYNNYALALQEKKQYQRAAETFLKGEEILLKAGMPNSPSLANTYRNLGVMYWNSEIDRQKAREYLQKARQIYQANLPDTRKELTEVEEDLRQMK